MPYILYLYARSRIYSYISLHTITLHARNNLKRPPCIYKAGNFVFVYWLLIALITLRRCYIRLPCCYVKIFKHTLSLELLGKLKVDF